MEHEHLDQAALDRLLGLDRTDDQNRAMLHHLAICPECYKVGGYLLDLFQEGLLPLRFSVVDVELARSRAEASILWKALLRLPHLRRLELVQRERPFVTWGLCELLCQESKDASHHDASRAMELGELAVLIAESLEEGDTEDRWVYQLRGYAWAHLGNARRVAGDLAASEEAFELAQKWWEAGAAEVGDALGYGPAILSLKASLLRDQRRFEECFQALDEAFRLYLEVAGDRHLAGRVLIKKFNALVENGETDRAIPLLSQAKALIDQEREPRLLFWAQQNLLDNLSKAGRFAEARTLLPQVQELSRSAGSQLDRVRLRWVEARIAAGLGESDAARQAFSDARQGFLDQSIAYDAALVSLETAIFLIQEGRTAEVRELAREMIPIFQAQDIHREALAALAVFQAAAALDSATVELAREAAALLSRRRASAPEEVSRSS